MGRPARGDIAAASVRVFQDGGPSEWFTEPYPLLVIRDALPAARYAALANSFPSRDQFREVLTDAVRDHPERPEYARWRRRVDGSNQRLSLPYAIVADAPVVPAVWRAFLASCCTSVFAQTLLDAFAAEIRRIFPEVAVDDLRVGRRYTDVDADLMIDAILALNTPARRRTSVTKPHTDNPEKLISGMLYFAEPGDTAGGDLIIHRRIRAARPRDTKWPSRRAIEEARRVRYQPNTAVFLLNTPWSVHDVSPRAPSPLPRRFVNFVLELPRPLF